MMDQNNSAVSVLLPQSQNNEKSTWRSVDIQNGSDTTPFILLCDHATNLLPPEYGTLGLGQGELARHIAYDIGALAMAQQLGKLLNATIIWSLFSRLLIDPNRGEDDPTLIMQISDGAVVPGNAKLDEAERDRRLKNYYQPYHDAITAEINRKLSRGVIPFLVAVHSYTHVWRGLLRKWHAAVLWDTDPRLPLPLIVALREKTGLEIGDNEPYSGRLQGNVINKHGSLRGLPNVLIEVRQDLIREHEGQQEWAAILADCLATVVNDEKNAKTLNRILDYNVSVQDGGTRHVL